MKINIERLKENLISLGKIGFNEGKGITRSAFTLEYDRGREFVKSLMVDAGLKVNEDPVGNLIGRLQGKDKKTIIIGSHIDTVPSGGLFDGNLGVLGGIEAVKTLIENGYENNYSFEVVAFIGEEGTKIGGTFGSRCFAGEIEPTESDLKYLASVGISAADVARSKRASEDIKNYLELHIEQGNVLYSQGISIGIVPGIVGISQYNAEVKGMANHAGTTPMDLRDDALVKASQIILKINEIVNKVGKPMVGTVGCIKSYPGAINVIPGKVEFTIELRDIDRNRILEAIELIKNECKELDLEIENLENEWEVNLSINVQKSIEKACQVSGYDYKFMYSGAGHDANPMSKITDAGMIFVPSKDGISHSPKEWTDWKDVERGVNVLLNTLLQLDNGE